MDKAQLREGIRTFLLKANKAGYAAGDKAQKRKEADGSETIWFEDGDWYFHDNFFGGEPYGGREIVKYKGKTVWIMVYYGRVAKGEDAQTIYPFLQQALQDVPADAPYRGPSVYEIDMGNKLYENSWTGTIENFHGKETITFSFDNPREVYSASYMGGLVDQ